MATQQETEEQVSKILEQYDAESRTRVYKGLPQYIVKYMLAAFAVVSMLMIFFSKFDTRINRAFFVGMIVLFVFLLYPATKKQGLAKRVNYIPWYDVILGVVGFVSYFYFVFNCQTIINVGMKLTPLMVVLGAAGVLITLEACRRSVGIPIVIVASLFILYGLTQKKIATNVYNLFYTTEGVIGTPIRACSSFIVIFVIFGAFLEKTGVAEFFIELANCIAGRSTGGPAKVAVISSALCGMVSGSSVGNTVTTGCVTIPLMKKSGYRGDFAGAVEAAASTGGQIMPPIMGAAAFLMMEYTGQEYKYIALRACLPAFLYFAGIFIAVHLEAKKLGLKGVDEKDLPKFGNTIKKVYLLLPLIVLTYLIITRTMAMAAFVAIIVSIVLSMFDKKTRMDIWKIIDALEAGAKSTVTVGIACAVAGIIACIITTTGIGTVLISAIVNFAHGKMIIAMFLTMLTCIVLGMGVPTTANYVIMATTCAPILVKMGMNLFAAHMFVFYFGIVADITPPVALAAYAGAAIAGSKPMKTAFNATQLAIAAFIVPYIFGLNPALLFVDPITNSIQVVSIIITIITAFVGIFGVAASLRGYGFTKLGVIERVVMAFGGLCLIYPGTKTDIIGIACIVVVSVIDYMINTVKTEKADTFVQDMFKKK